MVKIKTFRKIMILCMVALLSSFNVALAKDNSDISYEEIITKLNDAKVANKNNSNVREIIKEYTYNVGDDDSKNSSRSAALNQVKVLILEEIGVFVESYLEIDTIDDETDRRYVREEIKVLTAGIVKTKILDEEYDGETFYIKASVLVDPDSVSEGITEVLKIRANEEEISQLEVLLASKQGELDMRSKETLSLQKELSKQELANLAKERELQALNNQISMLNNKLSEYEVTEKNLKGELATIQKKVNKAMDRVQQENDKAKYIKKGMTKKEVIEAIGEPTGAVFAGASCYDDDYVKRQGGLFFGRCDRWYYGNVQINFNGAGIVE